MFNIIKKIVFIFILLIIFVPGVSKSEYEEVTIDIEKIDPNHLNISSEEKMTKCRNYQGSYFGEFESCDWQWKGGVGQCICKKEIVNENKEKGEEEIKYTLFGEEELKIAVKDLNQLKVNTPQELIGLLIKSVMGILGTITLIMIIYGGVLWMTSGGNSDKTKKARDIIVWATLGVIMIFASYAILNTIFEVFSK